MKKLLTALLLLVLLPPLLTGCQNTAVENQQEQNTTIENDQEQNTVVENKQEVAVTEESQITEEEIDAIIDAMPEISPTVQMVEEERMVQETRNMEERKSDVEKASGFTLRKYKNYWIFENRKEGFGLRLPFDTGFFSYNEEFGYVAIFRPKNDDTKDTDLSCRSEMHILENISFDDWKEGEKKVFAMLEEKTTQYGNHVVFTDVTKDEFGATYGTTAIKGNTHLYVFVNPFHENDICKITHKEIADSYFRITK